MLVELLTLLAVLNATIPEQNLPLELDVRTVDSSSSAALQAAPAPAAAASAPFAFDVATLTALAGVAGGLFAAFKKSAGKTDSRLNAVADTVTNVIESVKGTDIGAKDTAEKVAELAQVVQSAPPELKQDITDNAKVWGQDVKQYYENISVAPRPGELENDPVKQKLAQVNKITEKTEDD